MNPWSSPACLPKPAKRRDEGRPFIKWAGGKRWATDTLKELLSGADGRYCEPFLGSGAVFFALGPRCARLSDSNRDLIDAYRQVRDNPTELIEALSRLRVEKAVFAKMRSREPKTPLDRAIRFIYLNRTAYNGLWRVNRSGHFNVPFGCKPGTTSVDAQAILRCSESLQSAVISCADFRFALDAAAAGESVYLDPPYTVTHNNNGFRRYNERIFSWADQCELARRAHDLVARGCRVVMTNALHDQVSDLYDESLFERCAISRHSSMAADPAHRRVGAELLLISRPGLSPGVSTTRRIVAVGADPSHCDG